MSTGEPVDEQESSSSQSSSAEQVDELRAGLTAKVAALLDVDDEKARKIVEAFDTHVARPVEKKFAELQAHDLTKRNPYFSRCSGSRRSRTGLTVRTLDLGKLIEPPPRPRCKKTKKSESSD